MKRFSILALLAATVLLLTGGCQGKDGPEEKEYTISTSSTMLTFSQEGGSKSFDVTTDAPSFRVTVSDKWFSVTQSGNKVTVTAPANTSPDVKSATVTVTAGNSKAEVYLLQGGKSSRPADDPYPQAEYQLADKAIFVKPDYTKGISASDPEACTFTVPASAVGSQKPETGQILIMNTTTDLFPRGLLAKVLSVSDAGGSYTVKYENIRLEDAFESLHIEDTAINLADYVKEIRDADGNKVEFAKTKDASQETYHLELPAASWPLDFAGLEIAPIFKMDLTLYFQAIVEGFKLYSFNFDTKIDLEVGATIACGYEGKAIDERVPLYEIICGAVPVGAIIVTPTIGIHALLEVSGKVSVEATVTYKTSKRYGLHYDAVAGWCRNDYSAQNKNDSFTLENISPKIEGAIAYGYSVGPAIGIYVEAVSAAIGYDSKTKNTLSGSFDLLHGDASEYMNWNLVQHLQNAEFSIASTEAVSFSVSVLTREVLELSTPDITCEETKWKVLPKLGAFPEFERTDEGLELTVWVKNRNWVGGQLSALVAEYPNDPVNVRSMAFPDSRQLIESLNGEDEPDSVALKGFVHLDDEDPDLNYAEFILDAPGYGRFNLGSFMQDFDDGPSREALMEILQDLYRSRAAEGGDWSKCNWFEPGLPLYMLNGVRPSRRGEQLFFKINVKPEWKMGATVKVDDHSKNCTRFGGWEIIFEDGSVSGTDNLKIYDSHFTGYYASSNDNDFDELTINSPLWSRIGDLGSGIRIFERLDLSYTPLEELQAGDNRINVHKALVLRNCPNLKKLTLGPSVPESYDVTGSSKLEEIELESVAIPDGYFGSAEFSTATTNLVLEKCSVGTLSLPYGFKEVYFLDGSFDQVEVIGNKTMTYLGIRGSHGNGVTVKDCRKMETVSCPSTGISKFVVENLPEMIHISVADNENLLSLVPDVFDEIRDNGGSVDYDIRYEYTDDGSGTIEYEDNGYGFWYDTEPGCGYHGKEPPEEDEEGYVTHPGESPARAAFRKVLQDLYACRKGDWPDCDWLDGSKALGDLLNVTAPDNESNNETYYVRIPESWKFGSDVYVKKHNKLPTENYGGETGHYEDWVLLVDGERTYDSFTVSDPRCYILVVAGEAKTFAVHSPSFYFNARGEEPWKYRSHVIPSKIHTLDFRGSGGYEFEYTVDYEHTPKVFKLRRYDGKNLNQALRLKVAYSNATPQPMPTIDIEVNEETAGGVGGVSIFNAVLPYGDLPIKVVGMHSLGLYGCEGDMIYMPQNFKYLAVGAAAGYTVNQMPLASGVSQVKAIKVMDNATIVGISAGVQESVSVSNCAALKEAYFGGSPITSFQMDNVPALESLGLGGCTRLTMLVPDVFEQLWNKENGEITYEVRYDYTYGEGPYETEKGVKFNYTDKGYGFYFQAEPMQGYHRDPH